MEEIIIFNECFNAEGRHIHLYRSKDTGVWAAYGCSAYKVAEMERRNDITIVKNYSKKLLIPAVIMGDDTCKYIASRNHKEEDNRIISVCPCLNRGRQIQTAIVIGRGVYAMLFLKV